MTLCFLSQGHPSSPPEHARGPPTHGTGSLRSRTTQRIGPSLSVATRAFSFHLHHLSTRRSSKPARRKYHRLQAPQHSLRTKGRRHVVARCSKLFALPEDPKVG